MIPRAPQLSAGLDSESLQADVMRFLAIIAICLLAVLALVRGTAPTTTPVSPPANAGPADPMAATTSPEPASAPWSPAEADPPARSSTTVPTPPTWRFDAGEAVVAPSERPPGNPAARTAASPAAAPAAEVPDAEVPDADPARSSPPAGAGSAGDGVALRFETASAFMALIRRGEVRVFAWNDAMVRMLEPSLTFAPAQLPERLHEILPATLPPDVRTAAPAGQALRWGVALPVATRAAIDDWLARIGGGELHIRADGGVDHVP